MQMRASQACKCGHGQIKAAGHKGGDMIGVGMKKGCDSAQYLRTNESTHSITNRDPTRCAEQSR